MNKLSINLTDTQKGFLFIAAGIILLSFLMGFFKAALYYLILVSALLLIGYGIIVGDFWTKASKLIKTKK